jgi:lipopolysaccharide/colanic/teichoic acid biosynthesis glycosyltransferase
MDCHYVRSWSIWRDVAILIKTVPAVTKFDETA